MVASYNEYFNRQQLAFNHGDFERIQLKLEEKAPSPPSDTAFLFLGIIITLAILVGVAYWFYNKREEEPFFHLPSQLHLPPQLTFRRKKKARRKEKSATPPQHKFPPRVQHILPTLRERERAVVQFLLDNHYTSTPSKIRHGTNIPKTSILRILDALKAKNIIIIESTETTKMIKLTGWFLEK